MQDYVGVALEKYRVPFISYRDAVWSDYENPPETLPQVIKSIIIVYLIIT
jgi:hypothetical protein